MKRIVRARSEPASRAGNIGAQLHGPVLVADTVRAGRSLHRQASRSVSRTDSDVPGRINNDPCGAFVSQRKTAREAVSGASDDEIPITAFDGVSQANSVDAGAALTREMEPPEWAVCAYPHIPHAIDTYAAGGNAERRGSQPLTWWEARVTCLITAVAGSAVWTNADA
ncbi:MAG: hypothetical protein AMXMBFR47_39760 [Planctomycetota bacterium]